MLLTEAMGLVEYAVILAVGNSNHQSQFAFNRPRAMLPVLGKPLVQRVIDLFYHAGIRRYKIVVGEDEGSAASYLHSRLPDAEIEFALQPSSISLTRTLSTVARQLMQPFIIANYNTFVHPNFPGRLLKHHCDLKGGLLLSGSSLTLSNAPVRYIGITDGQQVSRILPEKPKDQSHITLLANLAICGDEFVQYLSGLFLNTGVFTNQFLDVARMYLQAGKPVYVAESAWTLPVETDDDLLTLNRFFLKHQQDCYTLSEIPNTVQIIPPVRIDPQVSIGQGAQIGPRVYLEAGCTIGQYASVSDAIVLQNAIVPARQQVSNTIVSARPTNPTDHQNPPS